MPTLHIEHGITNFSESKAAFDRFADLRAQAGFVVYTIRQPVDDSDYVMIDLDFDSTEESQAILEPCGKESGPPERTLLLSPAPHRPESSKP
ncbi:MAG: hypothetical protein M3360_07760 [Actinomycetota bacterium]|nr:hypothetical protein [Actinomycetota bacterium]